jgi:hypothetical protein
MIRHLLILGLLASPALADKPMTGKEFWQHVEGRTIWWTRDGQPYGAETFHDGGLVTWQREGGACEPGDWFARDGMICFNYPPDEPRDVCWTITLSGGRMVAVSAGDPGAAPLIEDPARSGPLTCDLPVS